MNLTFCSQKNRCPICGGGFNGYELKHNHPFHLNKDTCIEVLQNTIKGMAKNNDHDFKMLSYLIKDFTQEQIDELEKIIENDKNL